MADCFCPCLISCHIIPQQFADSGYLRTAPAQIGCRFKGSHSRFCHKIIGINQNACINTVCLIGLQVNIFVKILQHLRHHFTGGRRIGFNIGKHCIVNYFPALPVMVKYHNCSGPRQKFRTFGVIGPVGIHYHHHAPVIYKLQSSLTSHKHICRVAFVLSEALLHGTQG